MMNEDFLNIVKHAVDQWLNGDEVIEDQEELERREKALTKTLQEIESLRPNLEPANKKPRLVVKDPKSIATNDKDKTLKDVALLIIDKCMDADLELCIFTGDGSHISLHEHTRDKFKEMIIGYNNIWKVGFNDLFLGINKDLNKIYNQLERQFSPIANLQGALKDLFKSNQSDDEDIMKWDKDFVKFHSEIEINFPIDMEKGAVELITGESGSGKSWFAKKWLPSRHDDADFIYYELEDKDAEEFGPYNPEDEKLGKVYQVAMQNLIEEGIHDDCEVYKAISELSRRNNFKRNKAAGEKFRALLKKAVANNTTVSDWWEYPKQRLEKLVIILDEMGKNPALGRGIADEVRTISIDICKKGHAKNVMLVLVGAGLDKFIQQDSIAIDTDPKEAAYYFKFGTDPMKSNVTVLNGPKLEGREEIDGIPIKSILAGKYSQVLATNTRMLTRGVIPVLKSPFNTLRIDNPFSRQVELGSTNIVMDYAARVYIHLNGLARLHKDDKETFEDFLLKQFRILVSQYRKQISLSNPAAVPLPYSDSDYETVLKAGLITSDITGTSKALRYLGCKGQTAPLNAQDGIAFEIVLQHHLVRLCRAEYTGDLKSYYCDRYDLVQAWPPPSTKKEELSTGKVVKEEVRSRYSDERNKNCPEKDATEIANLLKNIDAYALVLRQTVNNAQGADILVLSKGKGEQAANLDLYQAKHYSTFPTRASKATIGAFASLGVFYDPIKNDLDTKPKIGSAGYSFMGTQAFVDNLEKKLSVQVRVRKRVVVFSEGWESFSKSESWKRFDLDDAGHGKNVWIWTREMLEPTISALVTGSAFAPNEENG